MIERRNGSSFLNKAPHSFRVSSNFSRQHLDRYGALQLGRVLRQIHLAHSTRAELRADFITAKFCADWNHLKYFSDQRRACPQTGRTWQTQVRKLAPDCLVDLARGAHA